MNAEKDPEKLNQFISEFFNSIEQLEIILVLRNASSRFFSVSELATALRSNETAILQRLEMMKTKEAVESESFDGVEKFRYAPATVELDALISEVALAYIVRRFAIINLIYSGKTPDDRTSDLETFADAFNLKKTRPVPGMRKPIHG